MDFGFLDGRVDGQHSALSLVDISKVSEVQDANFFEIKLSDKNVSTAIWMLSDIVLDKNNIVLQDALLRISMNSLLPLYVMSSELTMAPRSANLCGINLSICYCMITCGF